MKKLKDSPPDARCPQCGWLGTAAEFMAKRGCPTCGRDQVEHVAVIKKPRLTRADGSPVDLDHREIDPVTDTPMDKTGEMKQGEMLGPFLLPCGTVFGLQVWFQGADQIDVHIDQLPAVSGSPLGYFKLRALAMSRIRPYRDTYIHSVCGGVTTIHGSIAEAYARDPGFHDSTFCCHCPGHYPLDQFKWDGTDEQVGS